RTGAEETPLALICAKEAQAVEDRRCIPERPCYGSGAQLRACEPVLETNRKLADAAVTEGGRDGEQLEVKRELLDEQQRYDVVHDGTAEDLQADLRVAYVEPEEETVELLIAPARGVPEWRIADDRVGMSLGSDRE